MIEISALITPGKYPLVPRGALLIPFGRRRPRQSHGFVHQVGYGRAFRFVEVVEMEKVGGGVVIVSFVELVDQQSYRGGEGEVPLCGYGFGD